jgi:hypothetical protein
MRSDRERRVKGSSAGLDREVNSSGPRKTIPQTSEIHSAPGWPPFRTENSEEVNAESTKDPVLILKGQ